MTSVEVVEVALQGPRGAPGADSTVVGPTGASGPFAPIANVYDGPGELFNPDGAFRWETLDAFVVGPSTEILGVQYSGQVWYTESEYQEWVSNDEAISGYNYVGNFAISGVGSYTNVVAVVLNPGLWVISNTTEILGASTDWSADITGFVMVDPLTSEPYTESLYSNMYPNPSAITLGSDVGFARDVSSQVVPHGPALPQRWVQSCVVPVEHPVFVYQRFSNSDVSNSVTVDYAHLWARKIG